MRKCHPGRWWWGIPVLVLLWAGTCWLVAPRIESDPRIAQLRQPSPAPTAVLRRDGQRILLLGRVGPEARKTVEARLRSAGFAGEIADQSDAAAPERSAELGETLEAAIRAIVRVAQGEVAIATDRLSIAGSTADFESYNTIRDEFHSLSQAGRSVTFDLRPPDANPFIWTAERRGDAVDLSGFVPSEAARAALLQDGSGAVAGFRLVDRMQTAGGVPTGLAFEPAVRFALAQLARLGSGRVELRGAELSIDGAAQDRDALAGVGQAMRGALPGGAIAGSVSLAALPVSPYPFTGRRGQGYLTLTGYVPDAQTRTRILDLGRKAFLTEQIVDELHVGDGAPPTFLAGVSFALENLARLASGEARISGTSLGISGEALYRQTGEQTRSRVLANAPAGWTSTAEIAINARERVLDAELCQDLLQELRQKEPVQFEAKKTDVTADAQQRLKGVAALLKRCGLTSVSVGIEAEEGESVAAPLARARAEAVIAALVRAGIAPERLRIAAALPENDKAKPATPAVAFTAER